MSFTGLGSTPPLQAVFQNTGLSSCNKVAVRDSWGRRQANLAFNNLWGLVWSALECKTCRAWERPNQNANTGCEPVLWLDLATCFDSSTDAATLAARAFDASPLAQMIWNRVGDGAFPNGRQNVAGLKSHARELVSIQKSPDGACTPLKDATRVLTDMVTKMALQSHLVDFLRSPDACKLFLTQCKATNPESNQELEFATNLDTDDGVVSALVTFDANDDDLFTLEFRQGRMCQNHIEFGVEGLMVPLRLAASNISMAVITADSIGGAPQPCFNTTVSTTFDFIFLPLLSAFGLLPSEPRFRLTWTLPGHPFTPIPPSMKCDTSISLQAPAILGSWDETVDESGKYSGVAAPVSAAVWLARLESAQIAAHEPQSAFAHIKARRLFVCCANLSCTHGTSVCFATEGHTLKMAFPVLAKQGNASFATVTAADALNVSSIAVTVQSTGVVLSTGAPVQVPSDFRGNITFTATNFHGLKASCTSLVTTFTTATQWNPSEMSVGSELAQRATYYAGRTYAISGPLSNTAGRQTWPKDKLFESFTGNAEDISFKVDVTPPATNLIYVSYFSVFPFLLAHPAPAPTPMFATCALGCGVHTNDLPFHTCTATTSSQWPSDDLRRVTTPLEIQVDPETGAFIVSPHTRHVSNTTHKAVLRGIDSRGADAVIKAWNFRVAEQPTFQVMSYERHASNDPSAVMNLRARAAKGPFAVGEAFQFAPINLTGVAHANVNNCTFTITGNATADSFFINPATGEVNGVVRTAHNYLFTLEAVDVHGSRAPFETVLLRFRPRDTAVPYYGPQSKDCGHGKRIDLVVRRLSPTLTASPLWPPQFLFYGVVSLPRCVLPCKYRQMLVQADDAVRTNGGVGL